jgi:6,7-dimethyl-8-ribityllumazine synthase
MIKKKRIALITSEFNPEVTGGLKRGALLTLKEQGTEPPIEFSAPGAFEIPLIAKKAAQSGKFDAVICLGCVIKGDTAHFEFISLGAAVGIQQVSLETGVPVTFGILTTYTDEQAQVRSRDDAHNKGREAALAALGALKTLDQI